MTTILILDDELSFINVTSGVLKKIPGTQVYGAKNTEEALKAIADHNPDILLLDYNLNEKTNGVDVFNAAKKKNPNAVGMLVTGNFAAEMKEECDKVGIVKIFEKPASLMAIKTLVMELMAKSAAIQGGNVK